MLSLIVLALILMIVFTQAMYGFFSALIMAICTLVCTLLAFGYYEPLAALLYRWQPTHADAGALVALLVIPLLVVRVLVDKFLPGNIVSEVWVDRVGGGLLGLFTAMLLVGTLVIATWMMPVGRDFMGCDLYGDDLSPKDSLLINAPGFTLSIVEALSSGSMGGKAFAETHDDLLLENWGVRNRPAGASVFAKTDSASLVSLKDVSDEPYPGGGEKATFKTSAPSYPGVDSGSSKVYIATVRIKDDCRDTDDWWRLSLTQFRLHASNGESYFPVGYLARAGDWNVVSGPIGSLSINREWDRSNRQLSADLIFRIPAGTASDETVPQGLAFRRVAKIQLPKKVTPGMPDEKTALTVHEVYDRVKVTRASGGVNALVKPVEAVISATIPAEFTYKAVGSQNLVQIDSMTADASFQGTVNLTRIQDGILKGMADGFMKLGGEEQKNVVYVDSLQSPANYTVVRLQCDPLKSDLFLGGLTRNLQFQPMVRVIGHDDMHAVGAWVKWTEGGRDYVHLYFHQRPDENQKITNRTDPNILDVVKSYQDHRKTVTDFAVLFTVPKDVKITGFLLAGGERYNCESPLSTGDEPRQTRRRRR